MKRTVQMTKNHGPNTRQKPKFRGFRKVRRIVYPYGGTVPMSIWGGVIR